VGEAAVVQAAEEREGEGVRRGVIVPRARRGGGALREIVVDPRPGANEDLGVVVQEAKDRKIGIDAAPAGWCRPARSEARQRVMRTTARRACIPNRYHHRSTTARAAVPTPGTTGTERKAAAEFSTGCGYARSAKVTDTDEPGRCGEHAGPRPAEPGRERA
jgi:hypothetical protein